ncbi:Na(+)/H(+) exchange regulatory cofactor NHE-RF2 [Hydra vulgaris]|uniref:Na(+)/H(+) exchange regulatory cofactor NHE-RF2 n=1 Tax=Hydra vulgaris TaxID=6087 RepID=A0ABM4BXY9_HYDVU
MEENTALVKSPRLCRLEKGPSGYGFNLHGEKGVIGQYISAVDAGSPAEKSGLSVGDRVVEVNGNNVENSSHADVVKAIKEFPNTTSLLVIDRITDNYMKIKKIPITADLAKYSSVLDIPSSENSTLNEVIASDTEVKEKKDMVVENEKEEKLTETVKVSPDIEGLYDSPNSFSNEKKSEPVEINENPALELQTLSVQGVEAHVALLQNSQADAVECDKQLADSKQEHESCADSLTPVNQQHDSENLTQEPDFVSDVNEPKSKPENEGERSDIHFENDEKFEHPPENAISDFANAFETASPSQSHKNNELKKPLLSVIPQRKKVKETKDDWKAKQDLFNKL